jgi:hypothetical protein
MKTSLIAAVGISLAVVGVTTYLQGRIVDRWQSPPAGLLKFYSENISKAPLNFGDWQGEDIEQTEQSLDELRMARATGYIERVYDNLDTDAEEAVHVSMITGKPQNVADHTPDMCYVAAGYVLQGALRDYPIDLTDPETGETVRHWLKTAVFKKQVNDQNLYIRIFWGWKAKPGPWEASNWAMAKYASMPGLYKLYMTTEYHDETPEDNAAMALFPELNEAFEKTMFPSEDNPLESVTSEGSDQLSENEASSEATSRNERSAEEHPAS